MEVRRFRWWEDEAAALAEEEGEEERRMAAKRRKRSIVELFAAVPKVPDGEGLGRGKRIRRKLEKGEPALGVEATKKRFKKEKVVVETGVRKKGKSIKTKVTSASMSQLFQDAIQKQKSKRSLSKKKGVLLEKKSMKGNKIAVLSSQKATKSSCHVQSILKKHLKTGMGTLLKNTGILSPSKSLLKPKHVTFSDDNDILGRQASQLEDGTEKSQLLQTSQQSYKDGKSQGGDNHRSTCEPQFMYQRAGAVLDSVEEDSSSIVLLTKSKEKTILGNSVDLNHCLEISSSGNCRNINSAVLSGQVLAQNFAGMHSVPNEAFNVDVGFHAEENHHKYPESSVSASLAVKARSGDLIRRQLPDPSYLVDSLSINDRNRSKMLQERLTAVHPRLLRSIDMVNSISSSAGSNKSTDAQGTNCVSACRNMYSSDDCVGLPLNSHGEFVKLHPSGTVDPNGMFKRQFLGEDYVRPSAFPAFFTPETCIDYAYLKTSYQTPRFCAVDTFGFHSEPYLSPTMSAAYGMDFRQSPSSERMEVYNYAGPSNNDPCSNQQEHSVKCFCPGFMGQDNQTHKSLQMHSCLPSQNYEQNTQPAHETTVRLMGKNFTLGTSSKQHRVDNRNPCPSKQIRDIDHSLGMRTKAFSQLFHGACVDPPSALRNSNGGVERPSCFSSVPEAELRCGLDVSSFRTSGRYQQPHLAMQNKLYVHPVSRHNEAEPWHQQLSVENHILGASEPQLLGSMHLRQSQNAATVPSYSPKKSFSNLVEIRPAHSQFAYFPRQIKNVTQRTPISSFLSGYAVQSSPGLTTQTKFTSLRPLPPSVTSSHVYSSEDAQRHGSVPPFYPSIALSDQASKNSVPGDLKDNRSMQQTPVTSNHDSSEQMNRGCKRPAKGDMFLTARKPCIAVGKDLNLLPLQDERLGLCGSRPDPHTTCLSPQRF
ncbi:hypothetical protein E2562_015605 [Oryza meyeriana var. granulata]|uniref:Uncharacterized protein n=1 Tax=Oryza meyeriana var. granulata TaxID=110450 RepID=A0A6G1EKC1_9ORYZ|nr:hypothetical protein E2562_015605 [Oryza meyeriana var. granulata]